MLMKSRDEILLNWSFTNDEYIPYFRIELVDENEYEKV